ncbi:hypothetical protein [Bacillus sp. V5-8f]|nr:hypothetical protein [Bacillus sp. V5-8f]
MVDANYTDDEAILLEIYNEKVINFKLEKVKQKLELNEVIPNMNEG